jgi:hypothetical protein
MFLDGEDLVERTAVLRQQLGEALLAVAKRPVSEVGAVDPEEVLRRECEVSFGPEQVLQLGFAPTVQGDDLAGENGFPAAQNLRHPVAEVLKRESGFLEDLDVTALFGVIQNGWEAVISRLEDPGGIVEGFRTRHQGDELYPGESGSVAGGCGSDRVGGHESSRAG